MIQLNLVRPRNTRESFEEQWNAAEVLNRNFVIYDLRPRHLSSPIPIVFIPGFTPKPRSYKLFIWQLFKEGRRVIIVDTPHGMKDVARFSGFAHPQFRKVQSIRSMLRRLEIERASVIAHSEGAIVFEMLCRFQNRIDESLTFKNAVLVEPAGITGPEPWRELKQRSDQEVAAERVRHEAGRTEYWFTWADFFTRTPFYYFVMTFRQSLAEAKAIAAADICSGLARLCRQGVRIGILSGGNSIVYPPQMVGWNFNPYTITNMESVGDAYHQDILLRPSWMGPKVLDRLTKLEKLPPNSH